MIFAVFTLEREPPRWADLPHSIKTWVQIAGGVAAIALLLWYVAFWVRGETDQRKTGGRGLFYVASILGAVAYAVGFAHLLSMTFGIVSVMVIPIEPDAPLPPQPLFGGIGDVAFTLGGFIAMSIVTFPILRSLAMRMRAGRIWALARLSLKEAIRSRVVWVFAIMALVFLFFDWFVPYRPEDQVRNYVRVIYWSLTPLFLLTASLLGAFSIPTDIRNQSIHTIVTKPVEKFEIVLGRFLGYGMLLTIGLAVLTGLSLLYVLRGVTPEAAKESFTARVPVYADNLWFLGVKGAGEKGYKGINVGRVWDYRSYIGGPNPQAPQMPRQYAVWSFGELPSDYRDGTLPAYFEFSFDIFRLTKGKENQGVITNFVFINGRLNQRDMERRLREVQNQRGKLTEDELIDRYELVQVSQEVKDYYTLPLGGESDKDRVAQKLGRLFKRLYELDQQMPRESVDGEPIPALHVFVSVSPQIESASQMLGVAKGDLYLLMTEQPFWANFVKGVIGIWLSVLLILGLAVACSTYLSGVISWLLTLFIFMSGYISDFIDRLATGQEPGGGPFEAAMRLAQRTPGLAPLAQSPATTLVQTLDKFYRFCLWLFSRVIPDVNRFDLHPYVANGFDIPWVRVLMLDNLLPVLGFLLPVAVLAYYLMQSREVANPT
jgi:ABC-type transport system involved in multi-copper enzyme maturation permease subunit